MAYLKSNVRGINFQSMLTDLQLPVAALTRHVTANLKVKPLKANREDPDSKELGNPGQTIPR